MHASGWRHPIHRPSKPPFVNRPRAAAQLQDGKAIISGWSDGKIRAFGPQSGKLLFTIHDAHHKAVTALAATSDSRRIISGGEEGGWVVFSCTALCARCMRALTKAACGLAAPAAMGRLTIPRRAGQPSGTAVAA